MDVVGVLPGPDAARLEPDLALFRVRTVHFAHDPLAVRDLVLHLARPGIVKIQVIPAVPLGHPYDLAARVEILAIELARVTDERLALLVNDGLGLTRPRVHRNDPQRLVTPLVEQKRES